MQINHKTKAHLEQEYRICPSCSFYCNKLEEDIYCSLCGEKLIEICKKCGNNITNPYANYCKYCGEIYPGRKTKGNSEGW